MTGHSFTQASTSAHSQHPPPTPSSPPTPSLTYLASEPPHPSSTPQSHINASPLADSDFADIAKAVDEAIDFFRGEGTAGVFFVHCSAGISRSPSIVAAYLMRERGMTMKGALGLLVQGRPAVAPRPHFIDYLKELDLEIHGKLSLDIQALPRKREDKLALFEAVSNDGPGSSRS